VQSWRLHRALGESVPPTARKRAEPPPPRIPRAKTIGRSGRQATHRRIRPLAPENPPSAERPDQARRGVGLATRHPGSARELIVVAGFTGPGVGVFTHPLGGGALCWTSLDCLRGACCRTNFTPLNLAPTPAGTAAVMPPPALDAPALPCARPGCPIISKQRAQP
jgi:hypothetical protein